MNDPWRSGRHADMGVLVLGLSDRIWRDLLFGDNNDIVQAMKGFKPTRKPNDVIVIEGNISFEFLGYLNALDERDNTKLLEKFYAVLSRHCVDFSGNEIGIGLINIQNEIGNFASSWQKSQRTASDV